MGTRFGEMLTQGSCKVRVATCIRKELEGLFMRMHGFNRNVNMKEQNGIYCRSV